MFLKLTQRTNHKPIFVKIEALDCFVRNHSDEWTIISVTGQAWAEVKETPEEIIAKLGKIYNPVVSE